MCEKATATTTRKEIDLKEAKNILHYLSGDDETSTDDIIDRFSQISPKYDKVGISWIHISFWKLIEERVIYVHSPAEIYII